MAKKVMLVCRIEYETKDRTNWKANIIAYSMQDAIDLLIKRVMHFDRYISTQIVGEVDIIEDKVFEDYFVSNTQIVETIIGDPDADPKCPWCDKEFKSKQTLGTHIKKFHID